MYTDHPSVHGRRNGDLLKMVGTHDESHDFLKKTKKSVNIPKNSIFAQNVYLGTRQN